MKNIKITLLCSSLVLSGTASAGWLDFLNKPAEETAKVEKAAEKTQSTTADSINQINSAVKTAKVASDVQKHGLADTLVKQLGVSKTQAEGGSGALFQMAKSGMSDSDFGQVSESVPGMSGLLGAVPEAKPAATESLLGSLASATGNDTLISAASLVNTFEELGMSKDMVSQFTPVVVEYVKANGGEVVANLLSTALGGL